MCVKLNINCYRRRDLLPGRDCRYHQTRKIRHTRVYSDKGKRYKRAHEWKKKRLRIESVCKKPFVYAAKASSQREVYFLVEIFVGLQSEREATAVVCSRHSNATRESMFHQRRAERKVRKRPASIPFPKVYSSPFELFLLVSLRVVQLVLFQARNKYVSRHAVFRRGR